PAAPAAESLEELRQRGIAAAQAGRRNEAHAALVAYVERDERNVDAWYWLSTVLNDPADIEVALDNTLHLDPNHTEAAQALRELREWHLPPPDPAEAHVLNPVTRRAMLDPSAPDAWAGV